MNDTPMQMTANRSADIKDLAGALVKAQAAMEGARKDKNNPHFKSAYADIAAVWDAIREPLTANGLAIVQMPSTIHNGIEIETMLIHSSGQYISTTLGMPAKMDAHGIGSAITYARRYALMAVAGVAPVDDDGNGASARQVARPSAEANPNGWVDDAVKDGLMPDGDRRSMHQRTYVKVADRPTNPEWLAKTKKKVDVAIGTFGLIGQTVETIDAFWESHAKEFDWIEDHMPAEFERLKKAYMDSREAAQARMPNTLMAG